MHSGNNLTEQFHSCMPLFIALGDEVRLSIIEALSRCVKGEGPMGLNVNEITRQTQLSRPAISHHLKILKDSGLIDVHQSGTSNYYYLTLENGTRQLMNLGTLVNKNFV